MERSIDLVVLSAAELGFPQGAIRREIYAKAISLGLELCPAEVGPQLRLQYQDQPMNEWLLVAMEPIADSACSLEVFRVGRDSNGSRLDTSCDLPIDVWGAGARWVFARARVTVINAPNIISIDRSKPFDPVPLLGLGWSVIEAETDVRSTALTEVDLSKVLFEDTLRHGENCIRGEERLKRLKKAKRIRLDAKIFQALWEDKSRIPESWKEQINGNSHFIFFDGTILRSPSGRRCALYLYFDVGLWRLVYDRLDLDRFALGPSVVLASELFLHH